MVRPSGFDSGMILGPSLRTSPGDVLSTARERGVETGGRRGAALPPARYSRTRVAFVNTAG
jgi:hypothetical protein